MAQPLFYSVTLTPSFLIQDEMDHGLKMAHVDMYKFKLRERERRKRVAREHQLVSKYRDPRLQ